MTRERERERADPIHKPAASFPKPPVGFAAVLQPEFESREYSNIFIFLIISPSCKAASNLISLITTTAAAAAAHQPKTLSSLYPYAYLFNFHSLQLLHYIYKDM